MTVDIVPFRVWAGRPLPQLTSIPTPTSDVWLHHGASGASSLATIRAYLRHHVQTNGWATIGYSFLIAGGTVYEGRGPGRQGAHTEGQNRTSHGIVIAGDYRTRQPATQDVDALVDLLRHGHRQRWWRHPRLSGGHRDAPGASTSCPGDRLYRLIPDINRRAGTSPKPQEDDMPSGWAKAAWDRITAAGVLDGTRPKDPVTREELAVVIDRLGVTGITPERLQFLNDTLRQVETLDPPTNSRWALALIRDLRSR